MAEEYEIAAAQLLVSIAEAENEPVESWIRDLSLETSNGRPAFEHAENTSEPVAESTPQHTDATALALPLIASSKAASFVYTPTGPDIANSVAAWEVIAESLSNTPGVSVTVSNGKTSSRPSTNFKSGSTRSSGFGTGKGKSGAKIARSAMSGRILKSRSPGVGYKKTRASAVLSTGKTIHLNGGARVDIHIDQITPSDNGEPLRGTELR